MSTSISSVFLTVKVWVANSVTGLCCHLEFQMFTDAVHVVYYYIFCHSCGVTDDENVNLCIVVLYDVAIDPTFYDYFLVMLKVDFCYDT
jgi:hypothetical protein